MSDFYEQQRREQQRRWEESQRQQREREAQHRRDQERRDQQRRWEENQRQQREREAQQRRDQERRDQERRLQERLARERYAKELEEDRRRHNEKLREKKQHAEQMQGLREQAQKTRKAEIRRREDAAQQEDYWKGLPPINFTSFVQQYPSRPRQEPVAPVDDPASFRDLPTKTGDSRLFARIDDFILALIKKGAVPIAIIGAVSGLLFGWRANHPWWNNSGLESLTVDSIMGIVFAFLAIAMLRYVARLVIFALVIGGAVGFCWLLYKLFA